MFFCSCSTERDSFPLLQTRGLHEGVEVDPSDGQLLDVVVLGVLGRVPDQPQEPGTSDFEEIRQGPRSWL